ncbi:hypothetical protein V5799_005311 [Amblyomma americanum]|uniref:Uncharacterized protein n=1 Tax=Amblyomma americanum TaxID=6943 RepID=A0AAQ4DZL8_AMBAM
MAVGSDSIGAAAEAGQRLGLRRQDDSGGVSGKTGRRCGVRRRGESVIAAVGSFAADRRSAGSPPKVAGASFPDEGLRNHVVLRRNGTQKSNTGVEKASTTRGEETGGVDEARNYAGGRHTRRCPDDALQVMDGDGPEKIRADPFRDMGTAGSDCRLHNSGRGAGVDPDCARDQYSAVPGADEPGQ